MKTYNIKPEFLPTWGNETTEETIVTEREIERLSREWGVSVADLMEQVTFCTDTRFEIKTDSFEFRFGTSKNSVPAMSADEVFDTYMSESANDPSVECVFDTLEDARREFNAHYENYGRTYLERGNVFYLLRGEVAWIEANDYDEDGEFDQSNGTYDVSAEAYGVFNSNGHGFRPDEWDEIVEMMDDGIREELAAKLAPCSEQEFFAAYAKAHAERFGKAWELDKANPVF